MIMGKTTLINKYLQKKNISNNDRSITSLLMVGKIITAHIRKFSYSLVYHGLFTEEKKGVLRETRGTADLLYIDQHILKES